MRFRKKLLALSLIITTVCLSVVNAEGVKSVKAATKTTKVLAAAATQVGTVTSSTLYVRSGPGTSYKVIGGLKKNDRVNIINLQSNWYKINFGNTTGYVSSGYIKTVGKVASEKKVGYITASALNLRSGPSTDHNTMKVLEKGESVEILEKQGEWLKASYGNLIGWVLAAYVGDSQPAGSVISVIKKTIVIDAGHGGYDPGSIGSTGLQEKSITLAVSLKLGKILESQGHKVIYTRDSDKVSWPSNEKADLRERVDISEKAKADLYISVHCNSSEYSFLKGMETYYYGSSKSKQLAKSIQDSMVKSVKLTDRGVREDNFYVIKNTTAVAALVELAYISNSAEEKLLKDKTYQDKWAEAIAKGINSYINLN